VDICLVKTFKISSDYMHLMKMCVRCRGRHWCGKPVCPILVKKYSFSKIRIEKNFSAISPPNIFVGHFSYPKVSIGTLAVTDTLSSAGFDDVKHWIKERYSIERIVGNRSRLVNSKTSIGIKGLGSRIVDAMQEVSMASKEVGMEIFLKKKPSMEMDFGSTTKPMGPSGLLDNLKLSENPKIDRPVEKVFSDVDFKSVEAMKYLSEKGYDEYFLTRLLSAGTLGVRIQRRLVPTRWSITAVDDAIAKEKIKRIKEYPSLDHPVLFYGGHYGNRFAILLLPMVWSFELFEYHKKGSAWSPESSSFCHDYEFYRGRTSYAKECAGGYYAARLPVLEKLESMKRQAAVLVLREVSDEYYLPLGVWVVREGVRRALNEPRHFESVNEALSYIAGIMTVSMKRIEKESRVLDLRKQQKLTNYL